MYSEVLQVIMDRLVLMVTHCLVCFSRSYVGF